MSKTRCDFSELKLMVWEQRWRSNQLRWHKYQVNPYLIKYIKLLTSEQQLLSDSKNSHPGKDRNQSVEAVASQNATTTTDSKPKKFFIPLCGKTMDIAYLLSLGHSVFAIEGVKQAIETLDLENSFSLNFDPMESIYSTQDGKLKIYLGNIFDFPIEKWGPFDCIWDRGSLTALDIRFRDAYKDIMKRSVQTESGNNPHTFRYLLQAFIYDKTKSDGRGPKCVDDQDMESLYSSWTDFKLLESVPLHKDHVIRKMLQEYPGNVDDGSSCSACETIYILTNKIS